VVQIYHAPGMGPIQNCIVYGLTARTGTQNGGQGVDSGNGVSLLDFALVNCDINNQYYGANDARAFQFGGPVEHMVVVNGLFTGGCNWRTDFAFTAHNVQIDRSFAGPGRLAPLIPNPDLPNYPGAMPWMSPLGVRYMVSP
jgi:hypothetical protein